MSGGHTESDNWEKFCAWRYFNMYLGICGGLEMYCIVKWLYFYMI